MAQIANLVLADGQATPVNHTFSPIDVRDGVAKWADKVGGISVGFPVITYSVRQPSKAARSYKITRKITLPVLAQTSPSTSTGIQPAPTKAYELIHNSEWVLPEQSTLADRQNLLAYVKNFDANVVMKNGAELFETVW